MDIRVNLRNVQYADRTVRISAEKFLKIKEEENPFKFFVDLVSIISDGEESPELRRLAGLIMKNCINVGLNKIDNRNLCKWQNVLSESERIIIKKNLFSVFHSNSLDARKVSAQIFAKITIIELINFKNDQIFNILYDLVKETNDTNFCQSAIEFIDYVSSECEYNLNLKNLVIPYSTIMLKIVLPKIGEYKNNEIGQSLSALNAFNTIIPLLSANFAISIEKDYILKRLVNQFLWSGAKVRTLIFEIFGKIAHLYYTKLEEFISIIFEISLKSIRNEDEVVSIQAIELWAIIADKEFSIKINSIRAVQEGVFPTEYSLNYTNRACKHLSKILLENLKNLYIENDFEEWNLGSASAICLNQMIQTSPFLVIPEIMEFIKNHIVSNEMDKGIKLVMIILVSIFDGIGAKYLYENIYNMLNYLSLNIKFYDETEIQLFHWFLGKVCLYIPYVTRDILSLYTKYILDLFEKNQINKNFIITMNEFLYSFEKKGLLDWCFSYIFINPIFCLSKNTLEERKADEIFEFICACIINSNGKNKTFLAYSFPFYAKLLKLSVNNKIFSKDLCEKRIQIHLCRVIGFLIQKLNKKLNPVFVEYSLEILQDLNEKLNIENSNFILDEEILVCLSSIAQSFGSIFEKKVNYWAPYLFDCLTKNEDYKSLNLSIGIIGDICRTVGNPFEPFLYNFVNSLMDFIQHEDCDLGIKPTLITSMGDFSFSIYENSVYFSSNAFEILKNECYKIMKDEGCEKSVYLEMILELKDSILDGMTGVIQNFRIEKDNDTGARIYHKISWLLDFIFYILSTDRLERSIETSIGLLGDISSFSFEIKKLTTGCAWVKQLLFEGKSSKNSRKIMLSDWSIQSIYDD